MKRITVLAPLLICVILCLALASCEKSNSVAQDYQGHENTDQSGENNNDTLPPPKVEHNYMITYTASCADYNSVGEDWSYGVKLHSEDVESGATVTIDETETLSLIVFVNEYDAGKSDYTEVTATFSDMEIGADETQILTITVTENDGRFSGNSAVWEVTVVCTRIS